MALIVALNVAFDASSACDKTRTFGSTRLVNDGYKRPINRPVSRRALSSHLRREMAFCH